MGLHLRGTSLEQGSMEYQFEKCYKGLGAIEGAQVSGWEQRKL